MEEEAKAVQEVAKATGKAIEAAREAGGVFARYLDGPLEQASGIVTDELKFRRWKRIVRMGERSEQFLKERGLDGPTRQIPLSFAIPLLQAGTLEEDDSLQDLWAALLANSADVSLDIEPRTAFISILKSFSSLDARVMSLFEHREFVPISTLSAQFEDEGSRIPTSIHNLSRLGCLSTAITNPAIATAIQGISRAARGSIRKAEDPKRLGVSWMASEFRTEVEALDRASKQINNIYRTELGRDLLRACSRNPSTTIDAAAE